MSSVFERIGGDAAIDAAVDNFYEKVLADDRIKHFFVNTDMARQRQHQKMFMKYALGGLPSYPGKNMRDAHKHLVAEMGLNDMHFDAVVENLVATLKELNVPDELIAEAGAIVESTRADVLDR